jgi:hypothetical protein
LQVSQLVTGDAAIGEDRGGRGIILGCSVTAPVNVNHDLPQSLSGGTDTVNNMFVTAHFTNRRFNQVIECNILTEIFYSEALGRETCLTKAIGCDDIATDYGTAKNRLAVNDGNTNNTNL